MLTRVEQIAHHCSRLQDRVYRNQIQGVEELCQRVEEEWDSLDQRVIDGAIRELRKGL